MELKHAILGVLSMQAMSGYDLGRAFESSVAHFWHADQSQIYRTLDRLTATGAIETEVIHQDGKPDRKLHSLTEAGRAELTAWLSSPVEAERPKEPFLARLFFAATLGREGVQRLLDEREAQMDETLCRLRSIAITPGDTAAELHAATLRNGIIHAEAEREWVQETRRSLRGVEQRS